jgi:hypothetical protein
MIEKIKIHIKITKNYNPFMGYSQTKGTNRYREKDPTCGGAAKNSKILANIFFVFNFIIIFSNWCLLF